MNHLMSFTYALLLTAKTPSPTHTEGHVLVAVNVMPTKACNQTGFRHLDKVECFLPRGPERVADDYQNVRVYVSKGMVA